MRYSNLTFVFVSLLVSAISFAGGEVGNGGDALVCSNRVVLFDTFEAQSLRKFKLQLGGPNIPVEDKIILGVQRLAQVDPYRALRIAVVANSFLSRALFVDHAILRDIDDTEQAYIPMGCHLEQLAIQNFKTLWVDPDFLVSQELWNQLDNDNKAALVLHEATFFVSRNTMNSPLVRFLNSMMFSDYIDTHFGLNGTNDYFSLIKGTPLYNRVESIHIGDEWFYQIGDDDSLSLSDAVSMTRGQINLSTWNSKCSFFGGRPLEYTEADVIQKYLENLFGNQYSWRLPVFVNAGGKVSLHDMKTKLTISNSQAKGFLWCVKDSDPYSISSALGYSQ